MNEENLLSDKAHKEFYSEKGFLQVWIRSYFSTHNIKLHSVFFILSIVVVFFIKISYPFSFRSYIEIFSDILFTYSSTIIGFLLVSFSILLSISNVRNTFSYFVKKDKLYQQPLLKVILDHFIFPIGVFLILLIISLVIRILNSMNLFSNIRINLKVVFFKFLVFSYVFLLLLSISELIDYFFNMYRFIVITSHTISREYEEEIVKKIVKNEEIDILELDNAKMIANYQKSKKVNKT